MGNLTSKQKLLSWYASANPTVPNEWEFILGEGIYIQGNMKEAVQCGAL